MHGTRSARAYEAELPLRIGGWCFTKRNNSAVIAPCGTLEDAGNQFDALDATTTDFSPILETAVQFMAPLESSGYLIALHTEMR